MEHLRNLQSLFEDGFISAAEYEHRRQQLIDKLTDTTLAPSAEEDFEGERSSSSNQKKARKEMRRYSYRGDMVSGTRRAATSTTSTSTTSAYDSDVVRSSRAYSLRHEPYGTPTSSCAPAADPIMDMAQKYTLSRKIGQLPEEALPSVLKIVERLSPRNLRQSGEDWTFDLETLEDHTLWKLNDFVNAQIKHHFGGKDHTAWDNHEAGMVEEEKPYSTSVTTESDFEDDEDDDQDAGLELNDDEWHDAQDDSGVVYYEDLPKHTEELKGVKRPRSYLLFDAGEKRKKKEDIKKKGKEQRERERATTAAKHTFSQESESDEGEDMPGRSGGSVMRQTAEVTREREVIDEMENESESEYEREEYEDPEYTTDTQLKQEDDDDEESDGDEEESDEDWTPADAKPSSRSDEEPLTTGTGWVKPEPESEMDREGMPLPVAVAKREPSRAEVPAVGSDSGAPPPRKPFKIQVCVYSLAKKSNTKRPYVCDACDKSFADRSNLIQHLRVHTKEKPYGCTYEGCEKRFAHSASLKEHLYTHTGDKPHLCHCGMSFAQASNLRRHQLVHTGEKPFACTVNGCKKSFTQKINLAQHLKRVHRIEDHDLGNEVNVKSPVYVDHIDRNVCFVRYAKYVDCVAAGLSVAVFGSLPIHQERAALRQERKRKCKGVR